MSGGAERAFEQLRAEVTIMRRVVEELRAAVEAALPLPAVEVHALVPYDRGDLVSAVHEQGIILSQAHEEGGTALHARVGEHLASRLAEFSR